MRYLSLRVCSMKKLIVVAVPLFFLASSLWALPAHRKHARPPYNGPGKTVKNSAHSPRPFPRNGKSAPHQTGPSDNFIIR
jgi:hypothetical protein